MRLSRFHTPVLTGPPQRCCSPHPRAPTHAQVVFVSTEVAPWSKAGGVGDVMAALPAALAAR
jgi:hypothetical protein